MENLHPILKDYLRWTDEHDEDYCYDMIHDFLDEYSRGELIEIMENWLKAEMKISTKLNQ